VLRHELPAREPDRASEGGAAFARPSEYYAVMRVERVATAAMPERFGFEVRQLDAVLTNGSTIDTYTPSVKQIQ